MLQESQQLITCLISARFPDRAVIALWLGHESVETTQIYLDANLTLKEEILAKITMSNGKPGRYKAGDELLAFLQHL